MYIYKVLETAGLANSSWLFFMLWSFCDLKYFFILFHIMLCEYVCVRACVRVCVFMCVRARVCVYACLLVCMCVWRQINQFLKRHFYVLYQHGGSVFKAGQIYI